MKTTFGWYFRASVAEIDQIWKKGILTVDANVLLDLYRYHQSTRDSLISSLQKFEGKKWLPYQGCREFFRNRTRVIVSSEKTFKQAADDVEKLQSSLDTTVAQLKGNRIIPEAIADEMLKTASAAIDKAKQSIADVTDKHPNFLSDDPVLERVSEIFSGSIGPDFKAEELEEIEKEAERRKVNKVPPGYLDDDKDGDRPYGDFLLWRQILDHAKAAKAPIIFVTSERKEDWWEKISGRTTGPRPELLEEAYRFSGQRVLIYQTDLFLEYAQKRFGQAIDEKAVEEIRAVDTLRRHDSELAVRVVTQDVTSNTSIRNSGLLILELMRPVRNFTGSGHFDPAMVDIPILGGRLIRSPPDTPRIKPSLGTGTNHDFNVHLHSAEYGRTLPVGEYVFEYDAACIEPPTAATVIPPLQLTD